MGTLVGFVILAIVIYAIVIWASPDGSKAQSNARTIQAVTAVQVQPKSAQMVCPHCQTKGSVTTRRVKLKKGISGGKAVGAFMTSGLSIFVTGLSRKEKLTEAKCTNCGSVWHF